MRQHLVESASNRAFCRAVKSFLSISVLSREELGVEDENGNQADNSGADYSLIKTLIFFFKDSGLGSISIISN